MIVDLLDKEGECDMALAKREAWQNYIDNTLIEWLRDPSTLDDDDTITPTNGTIKMAIRLATMYRDRGNAAPTRIVTDAHGGIVFERHELLKDVFETIRISENGEVNHSVFDNCRPVLRESWFFT